MGREPWDGRYETSDEGQQSLEDDILDAMSGKFSRPTPDGKGTEKITDHSVNIYYPSDVSDNGHSHDGYNRDTGETYHHD